MGITRRSPIVMGAGAFAALFLARRLGGWLLARWKRGRDFAGL